MQLSVILLCFSPVRPSQHSNWCVFNAFLDHACPPTQALEDLLNAQHVRCLVLPSIKALLPMWQGKFRFTPFTIEEQKVWPRGGNRKPARLA
jgi:hypothetical protein